MPYMKADTSAKVGFRPYHQTDAFAAAHLSGYGSGLAQNHPFKPEAWHLHGADGSFLGTYHFNRPFDPWELYPNVHATAGVHGLSGFGDAFDDAKSQAADELLSSGHITKEEHDALIDGSRSWEGVLGYDPTDQSSWYFLVYFFRSVNQDLQKIERDFASEAPKHPGDANFIQLGRELIAKRTEYSNLASEFARYWTLVMGSAPPGLAGLGLVPILWVAGAGVLIFIAFATLSALETWSKGVDVQRLAAQTAQVKAVTDQHLVDVFERQRAAGDTAGANATLELMKQRAVSPPLPSDGTQWLMDNAKWIGLGAAGLIVLGPLSQGLFGRGRR